MASKLESTQYMMRVRLQDGGIRLANEVSEAGDSISAVTNELRLGLGTVKLLTVDVCEYGRDLTICEITSAASPEATGGLLTSFFVRNDFGFAILHRHVLVPCPRSSIATDPRGVSNGAIGVAERYTNGS